MSGPARTARSNPSFTRSTNLAVNDTSTRTAGYARANAVVTAARSPARSTGAVTRTRPRGSDPREETACSASSSAASASRARS